MTGVLVRAAAALGLLVLLLVGPLAGSASAASCEPDGVPSYAGSGLSGQIDGPVDDPSGKTLYGEYGFAGLRWTTCDLGRGPDAAADPIAVLDTFIGNALLGGGAILAATMSELHSWASDPSAVMGPIDSVVDDISDLLRRVLWSAWSPAVIAIAAVMIIAKAQRGETRSAVRTIGALLLAATAVAWVAAGPTAAAQSFDGVVSEIVDDVDRSVLGMTSQAGVSAEESRGAVFHDKVLVEIWERGALGDDTAAEKYGGKLYETGTVKYGDDVDADDRRDSYGDLAGEIEDSSSAWYDTLRGKGYNRSGMGLLAFLTMSLIAVIRIPAELLVVIGLLVVRFVVMFAPVFALAAIPEASRPVARAGLKMVLAAVVNVAVFGVIAAIHTGLVAAILANSSNLILTLFLMAALTAVVWIMSKPFRSPVKPASGEAAAEAMAGPGRMAGAVMSMAGPAAASYLGGRQGADDGEAAADGADPRHAEEFSRAATERPVVVTQLPHAPEHVEAVSAGDRPAGALPAGSPQVGSSQAGLDAADRPAPLSVPDGQQVAYVPPARPADGTLDGAGPATRLVEPEYDADGDLTYEIFNPDRDAVSDQSAALVGQRRP